MYSQIYDLIVQYVYNGEVLDNFQQLVCTELSTVLSVFCLSLPVLIIVWFFKFVVSSCKL